MKTRIYELGFALAAFSAFVQALSLGFRRESRSS
jgi:hypothetical protein